MFDADTIQLITTAPRFEGLNLEALPQDLTKAYAAIVSARMRLRQSSDVDPLSQDVIELIDKMKRLAFANEALVAATAGRPDRAAAAFVAGSAHHVVLMAEHVRGPSKRPSSLGYQTISSEVSAALLFLIAEASADAAEMAKLIVVQTDDAIEARLLESISHLTHGRLRSILDLPMPAPEQILATDQGDQGVRTLNFLLLQGIVALARLMLGETELPVQPHEQFEEVKALCIEPLSGPFEGAYSICKHASKHVFETDRRTPRGRRDRAPAEACSSVI